MSVQLNLEQTMIIRQAYGLLDYFGDIGGLIDLLYSLAAYIFYQLWQGK